MRNRKLLSIGTPVKLAAAPRREGDAGMSAEDEFAIPIGTGMTRVSREEQHEFDVETAERLRATLAAFDAARDRAAVEARAAWIGPR